MFFSVLPLVHEGARGTYNIESKIQRNRIKNTQDFPVDFLLQNSPSLAPIALRKEVTSEVLVLETQDLLVRVQDLIEHLVMLMASF